MQLSKKLQEIVDAISSDRQALLDSINGLSDSQLDHKGSDEEWSISDILHHLALTDEASAGLAHLMIKKASELDLTPDSTPEVSALNCLDHIHETARTSRFQAPDRVAPKSHLPASESLARLKASREKVLAAVERLAPYDLTQLTYPHPIGGDFNMYQWLLMAGFHESRHAAQIRRIKSQPGFPSGS